MYEPLRVALLSASVLSVLPFGAGALAAGEGSVTFLPSPPIPGQAAYTAAAQNLAAQVNQPITGASTLPVVEGGDAPPSLEQLQAARPGDQGGGGLETGRAETLRQAALIFGAQGGLAARSFAINEMLRRHEAQLNTVYDFRPLVLPVGAGQTLMRPPIISEAQMAFALGENGQVARETSCIFEITREAQLTSAPPNWRAYLVRTWGTPARPADAALPRTSREVEYWNRVLAEGWAQGERQAVDIFLSDLGRLQRDIVGMARYRVLLRVGLVEEPRVAFQSTAAEGGRSRLAIGDRTVRITDQPGLQANRRRWRPGAGCR
ncbi:type IV secretory system conjugative DNA transfer family protein [Plastoroseomonas hellenica]|uniref:type IV secretory system conjugative DNA transfer family protein n=1 Tax=Plastoroseomonas hellenica TaxID=2687306 RepID=UPI001BA9E1D9|nr:type IV secretory system conjugative DNA transfer family protein [Plastoroseomonas hellenica]MBR0641210.1 type IV secretion system DotC family protein [Plastoroseomonas hellenica]